MVPAEPQLVCRNSIEIYKSPVNKRTRDCAVIINANIDVKSPSKSTSPLSTRMPPYLQQNTHMTFACPDFNDEHFVHHWNHNANFTVRESFCSSPNTWFSKAKLCSYKDFPSQILGLASKHNILWQVTHILSHHILRRNFDRIRLSGLLPNIHLCSAI